MKRRVRRMTILSIVIHLIALWLLPGPSFQSPREQAVKTVRVRLQQSEKQSKNQQEVPSTVNEQRSPSRESQPVEQQQPKQQSPDAAEPSKTEPPNENKQEKTGGSSNPPASSEEQADAQSVPNESSEQSEPRNATKQNDSYKLLEKDSQFRPSQARAGDNSEEPEESNRTTIVNEDLEPYDLVRTKRQEDTRVQEVVLREPTQTDDDTRSIDVPVMTVSEEPAEASDPQPVATGSARRNLPRKTDRKLLENPLPETPDWLERTGQDVRVILQYRIDPNGNVDSATVLNSSGYPELDALVTRKLMEWKYEPGDRSERRLVVFRFNLTRED